MQVSCDSLLLQLSLSFSLCAANKFLLKKTNKQEKTIHSAVINQEPSSVFYIQCIWLRTAKNLLYFLFLSMVLVTRLPGVVLYSLFEAQQFWSEARSDQRSNRKMFGKYLMTASHVHTVQLCLKQKGFSIGY